MSKPWAPNRPTVELRVSKIRREPPPAVRTTVLPDDSENQTWPVVIGMLAFALAFTVLIFWVSDYTSSSGPKQAIVISDAT